MNKQSLIFEIEKELLGVSETPYLDAKFFLDFYKREKKEPSKECIADFIERRKKGEPVSKIIHSRGFWALDFYVTEDVLDPRADSEILIEAVLDFIPDKNKMLDILDIGTGSGCLLISLLYEYKNAKGVGVDISKKALQVATENAKGYPALFYQKDFYQDDFYQDLKTYDVIISNPPYIKTQDISKLDDAVRLYDPLWALDGGEDGLDAYRRLAILIKPLLKKEGFVFFEIGQGQGQDVILIMEQNGFKFLKSYQDLGQIERTLVFSLV